VIKSLITIITIFLTAPSIAFADIYKWDGENGAPVFTNDSSRIPEKLKGRSKLDLKFLPPPLRPIASRPLIDNANPEQTASEEEKNNIPRVIFQDIIFFFNNEKSKFENIIETKSHTREMFRKKRNSVLKTTIKKQSLLEVLAQYKSLGLDISKSHLIKSIVNDAFLKTRSTTNKLSARSILDELKRRLIAEAAEIGIIVKVLEFELVNLTKSVESK